MNMSKKIFFCSLLLFVNLHGLFLFKEYPELADSITYFSLARVPTPIEHCSKLETLFNQSNLFIKRDDLTGYTGLYGGNKVRKLAFLLADAVDRQAKTVVTVGCAGTNHGLATACYAKQLGLACILMLIPQPNSAVVRQNLLLDCYFNAEIYFFADSMARTDALDNLLKQNSTLYYIPTGGSVPLGVLGYVDAVFELKDQIAQAIMPVPDVIYVPLGSCGTVAGLLLGCVLAGVPTKIIAVAVEPERELHAFENNIKNLFVETNKLLHHYSERIPMMPFAYEQLSINYSFCGPEYGVQIPTVMQAADLFYDQEKIRLEATYSAKACAALMHDMQKQIRKSDEVILFWNTYCGLDFSALTEQVDYHQLPKEAHGYFCKIFIKNLQSNRAVSILLQKKQCVE